MNSDGKLLTDITIRTKIKDTWLNNDRLYYAYNYQDHDRPEDIANKYYGDPGLGWLIIYSNSILNPDFDLPLPSAQFEAYLNDKYYTEGQNYIDPNTQLPDPISGIDYALRTVDPVYGYQKQVTYQYTTQTITEYFPVDQNTYSQLVSFNVTTQDPVTNETVQYSLMPRYPQLMIYDIEFQNNEAKRAIKILKKEYVTQAKTELKSLLNK